MLIVCNGSSSRILRPKARTSCPRLPRQRLWHGVSVKLRQCSCSWRWPEATSRDKERAEGVHVLLLVLCPLNIRCIALVKDLSVFWVSGWHLEKDGICNSCRVLFSILEWMDVLFGGVIFPLNRVCLWKPMLNQFFFSSNSECVRYVYHSTSGDLTCTAQLQKTGVGIQPGWPAKVPKGIILWLALIRVREELLSFVLCQLASPNTMFWSELVTSVAVKSQGSTVLPDHPVNCQLHDSIISCFLLIVPASTKTVMLGTHRMRCGFEGVIRKS